MKLWPCVFTQLVVGCTICTFWVTISGPLVRDWMKLWPGMFTQAEVQHTICVFWVTYCPWSPGEGLNEAVTQCVYTSESGVYYMCILSHIKVPSLIMTNVSHMRVGRFTLVLLQVAWCAVVWSRQPRTTTSTPSSHSAPHRVANMEVRQQLSYHPILNR